MEDVKNRNLGATPVTVIDREADSVFYRRPWAAANHLFLVRCDDDRYVDWQQAKFYLKRYKRKRSGK